MKHVEFNQGSDIEIVNISQGGLLLETEARLRPDLKIMLKLVTTEGVLKMDGHILRSSIFSLKGAPRYRTAIAFNRPFEMLADVMARSEEQTADTPSECMNTEIGEEEPGSPEQQSHFENEEGKSSAILTVVASDNNGVCLQESFELNDW